MAVDLGDTVPLAVEVTDGQGDPANAASVVLTVTLPDGTEEAPSVTNPETGRYECDYVPETAGLHVVRWVATDPSATFADVIDVRPVDEVAPVSLADVRAHLNMTTGRTADDEELRPLVRAAVERVARHLGEDELSGQLTETQRLAVLEVTAYLWSRSQRQRYGARAAGYGGAAGGGGDEPQLPLRVVLVDLLGDPSTAGAGPQGTFDDATDWPDPIECTEDDE